MDRGQGAGPWPWTAKQRGALAVVTAGLILVLSMRYFGNRAYVPEEQPLEGVRSGELESRVDPNSADAATLAALPVIGLSLAQRIVEEREAFTSQFPGERAYTCPRDLMRVKGIGEATVSALEPCLIFPAEDRPAAGP